MTRKQRRMTLVGGALAVLALAAGLVLYALRGTIAFFATPSEIAEKGIVPGQRIRIGGAVEMGSVVKDGTTTTFVVTDSVKSLKVTYTGQLPDLFRAGQCVVAEGKLETADLFHADTVLAKHDESYMPPEVASSLKAKGAEHLCEMKAAS
jgi:cytochrome c-type biogenesis protein CcmE